MKDDPTSLTREGASEELRARARKLCGCYQNQQGGCPMPSLPCLRRTLANHQRKQKENKT